MYKLPSLLGMACAILLHSASETRADERTRLPNVADLSGVLYVCSGGKIVSTKGDVNAFISLFRRELGGSGDFTYNNIGKIFDTITDEQVKFRIFKEYQLCVQSLLTEFAQRPSVAPSGFYKGKHLTGAVQEAYLVQDGKEARVTVTLRNVTENDSGVAYYKNCGHGVDSNRATYTIIRVDGLSACKDEDFCGNYMRSLSLLGPGKATSVIFVLRKDSDAQVSNEENVLSFSCRFHLKAQEEDLLQFSIPFGINGVPLL